MDDREVVEQYAEVLLDQETHAEAPEHQSLSTGPEMAFILDLPGQLAYGQWRPDLAGP